MNEEQFKHLMTVHNNPHLYCAYQHKLGLYQDKDKSFDIFYLEYFAQCLAETGFFKRKPDSEDEISHDEVLGALYNLYQIDKTEAQEVAHSMIRSGYIVASFYKNYTELNRYVAKHFDVKGFIDFCAYGRCDYITQIAWSITILRRAFSKDPGWSHHLRTWIVSEYADKAGGITRLSMSIYRITMFFKKKTVAKALSGYFKCNPELSEAAKAIGAKW